MVLPTNEPIRFGGNANHMNAGEIKLLYEYNCWADRVILTACAQLTPEQYAAPASFGPGLRSLRETVLHILNSERGWRLICQGAERVDWDELTEADFPTVQRLAARWQAEEQVMRAYLGSLTEGDFAGMVRYQEDDLMRERVLWHCLVHLVNHGTQHRSEAAALLTSQGYSPGDFDFTLFLDQHL